MTFAADFYYYAGCLLFGVAVGVFITVGIMAEGRRKAGRCD